MELMLAQGFPVLDQTSVAFRNEEEARTHMHVCSFRSGNVPDRSRTGIVKQSGNTMHVHVVGCILAICLGWTETVTSMPFFCGVACTSVAHHIQPTPLRPYPDPMTHQDPTSSSLLARRPEWGGGEADAEDDDGEAEGRGGGRERARAIRRGTKRTRSMKGLVAPVQGAARPSPDRRGLSYPSDALPLPCRG